MKAELKFIQDSSKKIVQKYFPEEYQFFQPIWEVFNDLLEKWKGIEPDNWPFRMELQPELLESFGAVDGALDLMTPSIIAVMAASTYHLGTLENKLINENKISEIASVYIKKFFPENKEKLKDEIRKHVVPLLEIETFETRKHEAKKHPVRESIKETDTSQKVKIQIPTEKKTKLIFSERGVEIDGGKPKNTNPFKLIKYIFERIIFDKKKIIHWSDACVALSGYRNRSIIDPIGSLRKNCSEIKKLINIKASVQKGFIILEKFDLSKFESNIIDAKNLFDEINEGGYSNDPQKLSKVLSLYLEYFNAQEQFVNFCYTLKDSLSKELIRLLHESKYFFDAQKKKIEGTIKRIEEDMKMEEDKYYEKEEEFRMMDKVVGEFNNRLDRINDSLEKIDVLIPPGEKSNEEKEFEEIIDLIENIKKDESLFDELFSKNTRFSEMIKSLENIISKTFFSKKIGHSNLIIYIQRNSYKLIKKINTENFKKLKGLMSYFRKTLYGYLEKDLSEEFFHGITPSVLRNISEKRKVEKELRNIYETNATMHTKIIKKLKWNKEKYYEICKAEEMFMKLMDLDDIIETHGKDDEKINKFLKNN